MMNPLMTTHWRESQGKATDQYWIRTGAEDDFYHHLAFVFLRSWRLNALGRKSDFEAARSSVAPMPPQSWNPDGVKKEGAFFEKGVPVWVMNVMPKLASGQRAREVRASNHADDDVKKGGRIGYVS